MGHVGASRRFTNDPSGHQKTPYANFWATLDINQDTKEDNG